MTIPRTFSDLSLTALATGVLLSSMTAYAVTPDSQQIMTLCSTSAQTITHTTQIGEITGIAQHRSGYLQINQATDDTAIKAALLALITETNIGSQCWEYLNTAGLLNTTRTQDKNLIARVYFAFDSQHLTPESQTVLKTIAQKLKNSPQTVTLNGHTDSVGTQGYNYTLGLQRAKSSMQYLIDNEVKDTNLKSKTYGETQPIESNTTSQGRAMNRRVDVVM
ncbi:OmpA family protein [Photobacterium profundum]|uniref:OmpA family protein n=1 Tax=Photobacterium profundum TaxID=74109 RepID=UPI003D0BD9DE